MEREVAVLDCVQFNIDRIASIGGKLGFLDHVCDGLATQVCKTDTKTTLSIASLLLNTEFRL